MYISNINSTSIKVKQVVKETVLAAEETMIYSEDMLIALYLRKGAAKYSHEGQEGEIKKHDFIILNPKHHLKVEAIRNVEWIRLDMKGILFTSSVEIDSKDQLFVVSDSNQIIDQYLNIALLEEANRFRGSNLVLRRLVEIVLAHVLRHNELSIKDSTSQVKNDEISKVQDYIRENFSQKITLDQLSELVDINKYYLIRLFKQQTGLSPIDYLIHVRLEEAEKLLTQTNLSIADISSRVGFHSPSHFSKTFKETNNMTPSMYRRKHTPHNNRIK